MQTTNRRMFLGQLAALGSMVTLAQTAAAGALPTKARRIVLSCPTASLDEFRRLAELGAELGATHIDISDLPKAKWQWYDISDPWPNWGMLQASFFKIAPPEQLQPWIPADYAHRCQDILAGRGEILRKLRLHASFSGAEPMWLPEAVYQAYPEWRGPRCQYPPRAHDDYYTPCIDRAEVLALYRKAVATISHLVPVEEFNFLANDSGSGICWHPGLYPGVNGPAYCKDRPMNERLDGWMRAVQAGAADSGSVADVTIAGRSLTPDGKPRKVQDVGPANYLYFSGIYPVVGIPQPCAFAEQMQTIEKNDSVDIRWNIDSVDTSVLFDLLREWQKSSPPGLLARAQCLDRVAARQAGVVAGPHLLRAWELTERAVRAITPINEGGPILLLGSINQRWLVRPLVPFPLELKEQEKGYYRRFQMQAWGEEIAADLMALQGNYLIQGPASTWLASRMFNEAIHNLETARQELRLGLSVASKGAREELAQFDVRLQAFLLTIRNAEFTVQYQNFLDAQHETPHSRPDPKWPRTGFEEGRKIAEADIVNTMELVELLESTTVHLFATAATAADEDVFLFNPDLVGQLRKKIEIQREHLPDHIRM